MNLIFIVFIFAFGSLVPIIDTADIFNFIIAFDKFFNWGITFLPFCYTILKVVRLKIIIDIIFISLTIVIVTKMRIILLDRLL
jgi:hypothetical protein